MRVTDATNMILFLLTLVLASSWTLHWPRALVPGPLRGFHPAGTVHAQDALGGRISRFHNVKLYGGIVAVGQYYAKIKVGGQTIRVFIDTGSSMLAFPMRECTSCRKGDMRYDIAKSNSGEARIVKCADPECRQNQCNSTGDYSACAFSLRLDDGSSARGMLVNDVLELGNVKFPVTFGGIRDDSPDFQREQVDGIMGMGYRSLSCESACAKSAWESARDFHKLDDLFTICITDDGGVLTLGGFDERINTTAVTWVPMRLSDPPEFYNMRLLSNFKIGNRSLVFPSYYRTIMASGTTLVVFSENAFQMLVDHLQSHYCHIPGICGSRTWFRPASCKKLSDIDRLQLPTLEFQLEGFKITLSPDEYMINYKSAGPLFWCVGIMALPMYYMKGGADIIFGNTVMKKYITIYDRGNKRIGFAESGGSCGIKHPSTPVAKKLDSGLEPVLGACIDSAVRHLGIIVGIIVMLLLAIIAFWPRRKRRDSYYAISDGS